MTETEKALQEAAFQSPAINDLLKYQEAYIGAVKRMRADGDHVDSAIYSAVKFAIKSHSIMMAEKAGAEEKDIRPLREDDCFSWHNVIYYLMATVPKIDKFVSSFR